MSLGVAFATGLYGISFGALAIAAGLNIWQAQLLSLLMFSGGSQFAFVGVIATGGSSAFVAAIASAWLLGVRNGFYAVRMAPILSVHASLRAFAAQLTIDESTAVATLQTDSKSSKLGFYLTGAAVFVFWNLATFLGALLGQQIGDPRIWGLDAAAAAAFLGLVWPRLQDRQSISVAVAALATATLLSPFLPAGIPVLIAGIPALIVGGFNFFGSNLDSK
jgi:predicted branched-subunit amino acid permease